MKPAKFRYARPGALQDALGLLADEEDARILAGGQSLVPIMNFRLARPSLLVDINRVDELEFTRVDNGLMRIGALARHNTFESVLADGPVGALLPRVAHHIAHLPIRARGTFAGSLAHADPASEWCTLALAVGAEIIARKSDGERTIAADDFFEGVFTTALEPDEMIAEIALPLFDDSWKAGFAEYARRAGDYAIVMALAMIRLDGGRISEARIGLGNVIDRPIRSDAAEAALVGQAPEPDVFAAAGKAAAAAVEPNEDVHSDVAYKKDLVQALIGRALADAAAR